MQCPACHHDVDGSLPFCPSCGSPLPRDAGPDPLVGRVFQEKYKVIKKIGEGGMGAVYVGEQALGAHARKVAIKTLHSHLSRDEKIRDRFQREVGTLATLEHPNTVQVFDFGTSPDGVLYIVMEFVQGRSIADILEKEGPLAPARVDKILAQICGSLAEAHSKGIIHRDLKPDNIILTDRAGQTDFVKVLDFGIAKRSGEADRQEKQLTQQGMVLGTPPYMSPEQFTGQPLDARSDIYSLAVMAYEMLTGTLPFDASTAWEWATLHMTAAPKAIEATPNGASLPEPMCSAIMRALAKDKAHRFANITAFCDRFAGRTGPSPSENSRSQATANHKSIPPQGPPVRAATADMVGASLPLAPGGAAPALAPAPVPMIPAAGEPLKGKTQMGEPLAFPPDFAPSPAPPPYAAPVIHQAAPMIAPAISVAHVPHRPPVVAERRSNTGLILGIAGAVAFVSIVLVAWGAGAFKGSSGATVPPLDLGTGGVVSPAPVPVATTPEAADPVTPTVPLGNAPPLGPGGGPSPRPPGTKPASPSPTKPPATPPPGAAPPAPTPTPSPVPPPPAPTPRPQVPPPPPAPTPRPQVPPAPAPTPVPTPPRFDSAICIAARSARARNSPAAPNLEAQCRAQGGTP